MKEIDDARRVFRHMLDGEQREWVFDALEEIESAVEDRYMELPKDSNGEVIHLGDRVVTEHFGVSTGWCEVRCIGKDYAVLGKGNVLQGSQKFGNIRHVYTTIEDVLYDFAADVEDSAGSGSSVNDLVERYGSDIRQLAGESNG